MTRDEKNKVLLEFAGFQQSSYEGYTYATGRCMWLDPDGDSCNAPDFFDPELGIAWGFKWLVPLLSSWCMYSGAIPFGESFKQGIYAEVSLAGKEALEFAKEPAEALAEAVVKLLEAE